MRKNHLPGKKLGFLHCLCTATIVFSSCEKIHYCMDESESTTQGKGLPLNPYIVMSPEHLDDVRNNLSAHYKLGQNIDLTNYLSKGGAGYAKWGMSGWEPIGEVFTGNFDGAGHLITGLWINRPSSSKIGLFASISGGSIQNLGVEMTHTGIFGGLEHIGGLAGSVTNDGEITNCYTIGPVSGNKFVGGLVGWVKGGSITSCYSICYVSGHQFVGGLAGWVGHSSINNCFTDGTVDATELIAGGMAGSVYEGGNIANCYTTVAVSSCGTAGGLAGWVYGDISNCYAKGAVTGIDDAVGGVAGRVESLIIIDDQGKRKIYGSVTNCVALNPVIENTYSQYAGVGRITGYCLGKLSNNWAYSDMTVTENGISKNLCSGKDKTDGMDCAAIPAAGWWTSPSLIGPGWCNTIWSVNSNQHPALRWQK